MVLGILHPVFRGPICLEPRITILGPLCLWQCFFKSCLFLISMNNRPSLSGDTSCISYKFGYQVAPQTNLQKTLPETQRTQDIDSISHVISTDEMRTSCRNYCTYGVNILGPLTMFSMYTRLDLFQRSRRVGSLALVPKLATSQCNLCYFQFWPPGACIGSKFDEQLPALAIVKSLVTRWRHQHEE